MKINQLTTAQKRGALILLLGLGLLIGWRWRVATQEAGKLSQEPVTLEAKAIEKTPARPQLHIDLNTADTALLRTVKGIGPSYASRIVRFREIYGGIVDPQQLIDLLGLEPKAYLRIESQVYADTSSPEFASLRQTAQQKKAHLQSLTATARPKYPAYQRKKNHFNGNGKSHPSYAKSKPNKNNQTKWEKRPTPQILDINLADSAALDALPGVGPRTAQEIIKLRKALFFIHDLQQIADLWCVRPENFEKMEPYLKLGKNLSQYQHIAINHATVEELARHKYIRFKEARQIVAYRDQHSEFASQKDLRNMLGLQPEFWDKLAPYIQF